MNEPTVRSDVISFGEECQGCYRCIRSAGEAIRVSGGRRPHPESASPAAGAWRSALPGSEAGLISFVNG